jgi:hypothetical protein
MRSSGIAIPVAEILRCDARSVHLSLLSGPLDAHSHHVIFERFLFGLIEEAMSPFNSVLFEPTETLPDDLPSFLSVGQAAYLLREHPRRIRKLCRDGVLTSASFAGTRLIRTESLRELYGLRSDPRRTKEAA